MASHSNGTGTLSSVESSDTKGKNQQSNRVSTRTSGIVECDSCIVIAEDQPLSCVSVEHDDKTTEDQAQIGVLEKDPTCINDACQLSLLDEVLFLEPIENDIVPLREVDLVSKNAHFVCSVETVSGQQKGNLPPKEAWTDLSIESNEEDGHVSPCVHDCVNSENGVPDVEDQDSLHINNLPNEILQKIFSFCSHGVLCHGVAPVCHLWRDLAYDPIHWLEINLNNQNYLSDDDLLHIFSRASLLKHLIMKRESMYNATLIPPLCPHLRSLDMGFNSEFDEYVLEAFGNHCNLIENINIEGCKPVTVISVSFLCKMKTLRAVNLSHCQSIQDEDIIELANELPHLKVLNIDGISWISDRAVHELVTQRFNSLVYLDLDGAELTDDSIAALAQCSKLQVLRISFCDLLTDVALLYLQSMGNLKDLKLKKGASFSGEGLKQMFAAGDLTQLETLNLTECIDLQDDGVEQLVKCCGPSLTSLDLSWCWNITEAGLEAIVHNCRTLRILTLIGQKQISGDCFVDVPKYMPHLELLDLTQCNEINDDLVLKVFSQMVSTKVMDYYGQDISNQ